MMRASRCEKPSLIICTTKAVCTYYAEQTYGYGSATRQQYDHILRYTYTLHHAM